MGEKGREGKQHFLEHPLHTRPCGPGTVSGGSNTLLIHPIAQSHCHSCSRRENGLGAAPRVGFPPAPSKGAVVRKLAGPSPAQGALSISPPFPQARGSLESWVALGWVALGWVAGPSHLSGSRVLPLAEISSLKGARTLLMCSRLAGRTESIWPKPSVFDGFPPAFSSACLLD